MLNPSSWLPAPAGLQLPDDEVHVWRAGLDLSQAELQRFQQVLSSDEQQRAARFYFEKDRQHYMAARGFLRTILGQYLARDPSEFHFVYNQFGKPALATGPGESDLRFNLAHSYGLALLAFTRGREIGVDLEMVRLDRATDDIAQRFFAPAETAVLRALPQELRGAGFFNCWTRKEAFIKARGRGLSLGLDRFVVSLTPGESAALLSAQDDPDAASRWELRTLEVADGYAAALAVEGRGWELRCWRCVSSSIELPRP